MKVRIKYIRDKGVLKNERVVLIAMDDCDIGEYLIMDTTFSGDKISNKLRHTFWFPDKQINNGDLIVLYSKDGVDSEKENESGNKSHFFYWGLGETVWNKDEEDCAILFKVEDYMVKGI